MVLPPGLAGQLEKLPSGATYLSVPLRRGVIQVGTAHALPTATIVVVKTPSTMCVTRTDGRPLQARIINGSRSGAAAQPDVVTAPMRCLEIRRTADRRGTPSWQLTHRRQPGLLQLIATIIAFSIAKQGRFSAGRPGWPPPQRP